MKIIDVLERSRVARAYVLRFSLEPDGRLFGGDNQEVLNETVHDNMSYFGLHPRLSPFSVTRERDMITTLAIAKLYAVVHPSAKRVPQFLTDSVLNSEFKPDKRQLFDYCKQSETFRKLSDIYPNAQYTSKERIMDFAGTRRYLFGKALAGNIPTKYSPEFCVISKFLEKIGSEKDLIQIAKELYKGCIKHKGDYVFNGLKPLYNEHLFALPKTAKGFDDYSGIMPDIGNTVYNMVLEYANEREFEFLEALGVADVLYCIMTISCTSLPVAVFPMMLDDRKKQSKYKEIISAYFTTMLPADEVDNESKLQMVCGLDDDEMCGNPRETAKIYNRIVKTSAKEFIDDDKLRAILEAVGEFAFKAMIDNGIMSLTLCEHDIFYLEKLRACLVQWSFYLQTRNGIITEYMMNPDRPYSLAACTELAEINSKLMYSVFDTIGGSVFPLEVLKETLAVSSFAMDIPYSEGDSDREQIQTYLRNHDGDLKNLMNRILTNTPDLFDTRFKFNKNHYTKFTELMSATCDDMNSFNEQSESENPDQIFKEMEQMRTSANFDPDKFAELAMKFGEVKTSVDTLSARRMAIFDKYLERLTELESLPVTVTEMEQAPTVEAKIVLGKVDMSKFVSHEEYEEALQLMHDAESERDEYKRKAHEAQKQRDDAVKHAYNLERPAECGQALIDYAKRGSINTVTQAVAIAEGLSQGKLRILPSALESAAESSYNTPSKVKDALCNLADRYIEDLENGGVSEARKMYGRAFRGGESKTVEQSEKLMDQRTFEVDGVKREFTTHLAFGNKADKSKHIRIYFDVDMENRQIVVAYIGEHLGTTLKV